MAEVYQCSHCPPDEACGLDGESFDCSRDECHHPLTLEMARKFAAVDDLIAACDGIIEEFSVWEGPEEEEIGLAAASRNRSVRAYEAVCAAVAKAKGE